MPSQLQSPWTLFVAATVLAFGTAFVDGGPRDSCPHCGHAVCQPVETTVKEKTHSWEIDRKTICIPAIKWPWENCCDPPRCGKVKSVKVLKKVEHECTKCGYVWEVQAVHCRECK